MNRLNASSRPRTASCAGPPESGNGSVRGRENRQPLINEARPIMQRRRSVIGTPRSGYFLRQSLADVQLTRVSSGSHLFIQPRWPVDETDCRSSWLARPVEVDVDVFVPVGNRVTVSQWNVRENRFYYNYGASVDERGFCCAGIHMQRNKAEILQTAPNNATHGTELQFVYHNCSLFPYGSRNCVPWGDNLN